MEITRRGFLKMLVAAPVVAKLSLAEGIIKTATAESIQASDVIIPRGSWHLAIIDKTDKKILFSDMINGDPQTQAARIAAHIQKKKSTILTIWLTPMSGENAIRGQKAYYDFNNLKFT